MKRLTPLVFALIATPAVSEDTRQLDAHEHGVGSLNIAVEGTTVAMEFHAPGADIVGFEYTPDSAEDRAAIAEALAKLARPTDLFVLPAAAACTVIQASAELEGEDAHADDDHGHEDHAHDDHGHDDHAEEKQAHDDHGHDDDHAEDKHAHDDHAHDDHGHDDHAEAGAEHTEFHAEYTMDCAEPGALTSITFAYFDAFANAREVEVQIVSATGAQAFEVERDAPTLDLGNLF